MQAWHFCLVLEAAGLVTIKMKISIEGKEVKFVLFIGEDHSLIGQEQ